MNKLHSVFDHLIFFHLRDLSVFLPAGGGGGGGDEGLLISVRDRSKYSKQNCLI